MALRTITVITDNGKKDIKAKDGELLADVLSDCGFPVPAACGRRGTCRKCAVRLTDGRFENEIPDKDGMIRSCRAVVCSDASVSLNFEKENGLTDFVFAGEIKRNVCGIAVDIGTTTVAASILKEDGSVASSSCLNPQSTYGADVISRIKACSDGALNELTELVRSCTGNLISELAGDTVPDELVVSGNTTMLHIFCGISPESLGVFPFKPQFTDALSFSGKELGLNVKKVTVLPSVSAFIGSDIVSGIYALGFHKTDKRAFLADLGTNGELVFSDKGRLYCTSTAAGPALEGACIECGLGGVRGAVDKVFRDGGDISYTTVGGIAPTGICGAGLVDAVALMVKEKIADESGYLENGSFYISSNVYISQNDIRQFQLAKSAVFSGIETLLDVVGISEAEIDMFYIAGGLGYYINPESAFVSGLLPRMSTDRVTAAGNTSLNGALMCIGNPAAVEEMQKLSKQCETVELGGNPAFNQRFMDNMFFE